MKVYFVRHGETASAANKLTQNPEAPLSELGIEQSEALANRLKGIPFDLILCSPFERSRKTAEIINRAHKVSIEYTDLLKEVKKPSEILCRPEEDLQVKEIKKLLFENFGNKNWRHSDEENFFDLKARGLKFLDHLSTTGSDKVLVVSHGTIIRMITALMMYGREMTAKEFADVQEFFGMDNTGVSICFQGGYRGWKLLTWNNISSLD